MTTDPIQAQAQIMSIAAVVDMACNRLQIPVSHYFQKLLTIAKWETIQLRLDRMGEIKTVLVPISDVNTCLLPPDTIDWVKVGVPAGQFVRTIGINDHLSKQDRTPGSPDFSWLASPGWLPNGTATQDYLFGYNFANYGGAALPAMPGGLPQEGHFQMKNCPGGKELLLDGNIGCDQIYVECLVLGISCCGETILDPYIADYVLKKTLEVYEEDMNPKATEASIARRKEASAYAFTLVSGRTNSIDPDTLKNITRAAYRLTNHV